MITRSVAVLAFDGMEVLDFAGPFEVFQVAGEVGTPAAFTVSAVGVVAGPVSGRGGLTVLPTSTISDAAPPDVLVVPGGAGIRALLGDEPVLAWLRERAAEVEVLMSVCTGSLLLGAAGLLARRRATTHHGAYDELVAVEPSVRLERGPRFVRSGERLWTSAGVSAGIDLSLRVVEELTDPATRLAVVEEMEWLWRS